MDLIMTAFCTKVVEAGDKNGLIIGKNTGTDSTPSKFLMILSEHIMAIIKK
jgi:hypothetical protein